MSTSSLKISASNTMTDSNCTTYSGSHSRGVVAVDKYGQVHKFEVGVHNTTGDVRFYIQTGPNDRQYVMVEAGMAVELLEAALDMIEGIEVDI